MSDERPHKLLQSEAAPDGGAGHNISQGDEPPIGRVFHRVMRAVMFDDPPHPELDTLPLAQLRLLWTVFYNADATMKDFSERLGVSQSTVTQLADRLVRRGLVERKTDPADRRVVRLQVSDAGRSLLDEATGRQQATFRTLWNRMLSEDHVVVMRGLEILADAAEAMRAEQGRALPPPQPPAERRGPVSAPGVEATQPVVDLMARRVRGQRSS